MIVCRGAGGLQHKDFLAAHVSWISTRTSPSEKRLTAALPIGRSRIPATARASSGLALPVNIIRRLLFIRVPATGQAAKKTGKMEFGRGGRIRTLECRNQNPVP